MSSPEVPDAAYLRVGNSGPLQPWQRPLHELTEAADLRAWAYRHVASAIAEHPNMKRVLWPTSGSAF